MLSEVGLSAEEIKALARTFASSGLGGWEDIEWLADRFWAPDFDPPRAHHLLMAVGNFKRQGGTVIHTPERLRDLDAQPTAARSSACVVFGVELAREAPASWRRLTTDGQIRGLGVATATTLL